MAAILMPGVKMMENWPCAECTELFERRGGVVGRPRKYCSRRCRKRAARLRAATRQINIEKLEPWDGTGYERWTGDDAA